MSKVLVKGDLCKTLSVLTDRSELVDESGRVLGVFTPARVLFESKFPTISEEEIRRRCQEKGGTTLAEIWAKLGENP
jgi:hypothetical protein